jgi:hypothetical protein
MTVWCKDDIPFPELVIYMHILHTSSHLFSVDLAASGVSLETTPNGKYVMCSF